MTRLTDISPEDQAEYDRRSEAYDQARRDFALAQTKLRATGDLFKDFKAECVARKIAALGIQPNDLVDITFTPETWRYRGLRAGFYLGTTARVVRFALVKRDGTRGKRQIDVIADNVETLTKRETQET